MVMQGKRAKRESVRIRKPSGKLTAFEPGNRVLCTIDSALRAGEIINIEGERAFVLMDTGITMKHSLAGLQHAPGEEGEDDPAREEGLSGFNQYTIKWDDDQVNFKFTVEGIEFYGWYRKSKNNQEREVCWAVDLYARHGGHDYAIRSIPYYMADPRKNPRSLNADLCAAANDWLFQRCRGKIESLDDLRRRADQPQIKINKLETLDKIIMQLKEFRAAAMYSGGRRHIRIEGDEEDATRLGIQLDVTSQAIVNKGKAPRLNEGGTLDRTKIKKTQEAVREKSEAYVPDKANVLELVDRLEKCKDKSESRKIRAALRKMGHRGGARSIRAELEKE